MKKLAKTIELAIMIGLFLGIASASINLYSGESYSFESEEFEYYTVINNKSNMDGMNISWDGNTTISFSKYFASDNFTILFFNVEKEIIHEYHSSGGGGGSKTIYVENKTTEYINQTIYDNDTDSDLRDRIKKLDKDLKREKLLNDYSRLVIGGLLITLLVIAGIFLKKKNKK